MTARGFTLIELMSALLILALLALMSFRGLAAVLDARDHASREMEKWKAVAAFFSRFQRDVRLSAPRPVRASTGRFEFARFAAAEGVDAPRRVGYELNANRQIELLLWTGPDSPDAAPARHAVLSAVSRFEMQYLAPDLSWIDTWPRSDRDAPLPQAVRLRLVLASGEELVRIFNLR